jgi:hypothetical protein
MKRIPILFLLFVLTKANAQNEFAATAFYKDFMQVFEDAQTGFTLCKGAKRNSENEELAIEYQTKLKLPLADSGKLVVPNKGNPYVIYYFEPDKSRLKVDQRGVNLRDAILIAIDRPLYSRTETSIINNHPFTHTLFFNESGESMLSNAIFRQSIYFKNGMYQLSFEIFGKRE